MPKTDIMVAQKDELRRGKYGVVFYAFLLRKILIILRDLSGNALFIQCYLLFLLGDVFFDDYSDSTEQGCSVIHLHQPFIWRFKMRTLEQHELNEVSGAGIFSDAGALIDSSITQISDLLHGNTQPSDPKITVPAEVGNIIEKSFNTLVSMFGGFFQRK